MLRPTAKNVVATDNYTLIIEFDNGEKREFDVKPYINGAWYSKLKDMAYFKTVSVNGYTVEWAEGHDLCPDELYELSKIIT